MLGKRSAQGGLFEADHLYLDFVGRDTFYGFLASQRGRLFRDEEYGMLYCPDNGRNSVPPSMLSNALLLQAHDGVSDEEAKARADFDLRWKVGLGTEIEDRPFAKSTLQLFRAQLIIHKQARAIFERSLAFARESGYLRKRKIKTVLDTSNILGRGAVKDTYNLLADGIVQLIRALASLSAEEPDIWATSNGLSRYFGSSIKGEARINWDEPKQREEFLAGIVTDADGLLETARQALADYAPGSAEELQLVEAARLLSQLLLQDVERRPDGVAVKEGVAPDRIVSVHDPEMRHGHKSKSKRFDGHKVSVAVDPESQLITGVAVLPGNAPDSDQALELVEETEENTRAEVEETIGDCAYGDGVTRRIFAEAGRKLIARVPSRRGGQYFAKEEFSIDLETQTCRCPAGQESCTVARKGSYTDRTGKSEPRRAFQFDPAICASCQLRPRCVRAGPGKGRTISLHPQEALLQEARRFQESEAYVVYSHFRQVAEHRLARLVQLGIRRARYFGREKTLFQVLMAATVANLTLVATKTGHMRPRNRSVSNCFRFVSDVLAPVQSLIRSLAAYKPVQIGVSG